MPRLQQVAVRKADVKAFGRGAWPFADDLVNRDGGRSGGGPSYGCRSGASSTTAGCVPGTGRSAAVVGHDRGARVAHRWALDHPQDVDRLVVMDIIPTREMWRRMDADLARRTWHWLFHLQPDLPELLDPGAYVRHMIERWAHVPLPAEDVEEYVRAFSAVGAARAGFADYRASFPDDAAHDDADAAAGRRLTMPVRALWDEHSFLRTLDPVTIWRDYAEDVTGTVIEDCGHFLAEVLADLTAFLRR